MENPGGQLITVGRCPSICWAGSRRRFVEFDDQAATELPAAARTGKPQSTRTTTTTGLVEIIPQIPPDPSAPAEYTIDEP